MSLRNRHIQRARRRRWLKAISLTTVAVFAPYLAFGTDAAGACGSSSTFRWAGQATKDHVWEGLERFISRTSPTTAGSWTYEHEIFWLGVQEYQTTGCGTYGYCWLQAGHGIGSVLTAHTTTQRLYYEYEGPDGAGDFADFPTFASVGADDFYNSYRDGINDQEGHPYFEAWTNAGGLQQMAYTPMLATQGTDESEAEASSTDGTWPSIGGVALFGTNRTTTYSSSWSLFKSNDGTSWIEWVNSPNLCNESPYARTTLHNWSAFKAY